MDGTLLDTEKVYFDSLIAALNSCGFTDDVVPLCHAMIGLPGPECETMLTKHYGADFPACRDQSGIQGKLPGNF
jgi:phosphoglycolate phosphatase-like HAD superfamily hydrolase